MKTFIKWSGNKYKYASSIVKHFPSSFNTYIEPFVGSGAILLHLQPKHWIINDKNTYLIGVWREVRTDLQKFLQQYQSIAVNVMNLKTNQERVHYCRELTQRLATSQLIRLEKSALYLFLKNVSYMGVLHNHNTMYFHGFDMGFYKYSPPYVLSERFYDTLKAVNTYLTHSKGRIFNKNYSKILESAKEGDFVFLDPPYKEDHSYKFKYNDDDQPIDLTELLDQLKTLDTKGVKWLMTQADTKEVKAAFKDYKIRSFKVYRRPSKTYKKELIITNY